MKRFYCKIEYIYIPVFILLVSFPILESSMIYGADILFHLLRIESIKEGLLSGQFPVRLYPIRFNGSGDATGFFYPSLFLYIPAFLRIVGFSITNSVNIFILIINICTFFTCYWSFKHLSQNKKIAIISSLLYLSSLFRMINIYSYSSMGAYLGLTFIPMVLTSFYLLLKEDKKYSTVFILSFSCVMQSHILSTLLCCIGCFVIFISIFLYNARIFNRKNISILTSSAIIIFFMNIWFYYPFLEFYHNIDFKIKYPIFTFINFIVGSYQVMMLSQFFYGLPTLILCILGVGYFFSNTKTSNEIKDIGTIFFINFIVGIIFLILCTNLVPYKKIITYPLIGNFFQSIQSPLRLLELSLGSISLAGGISLYLIFHKLYYRNIYIIITLFIILFINYEVLNMGYISPRNEKGVIFSLYIPREKKNDSQIIEDMKKFDERGIAADYVYRDYLPAPNRIALLSENTGKEVSSLNVFSKNNLSIEFETNYNSNVVAVLPLLYYPGYKAEVTNNHKVKLKIEEGPAHYIKVHIPRGKYRINVKYIGLLKWRIAECISLISIVVFIIYLFPGFYTNFQRYIFQTRLQLSKTTQNLHHLRQALPTSDNNTA